MSYQHRVECEQLRHKLNAALQRAEAAEAKLTAPEEPKPYGWLVGLPGLYPTFTLDYRNVEQAEKAGGYEITPVFTRPAPAINLTELVPEWSKEQVLEFLSMAFRHAKIGGDFKVEDVQLAAKIVNSSIMRNIEEAK